MPYRFTKKESVEDGLRRIAAERLHSVLSRLDEGQGPEAVHNARQDIKKLRALLRLFRPCLPEKLFRREFRLLRKAAALLADVREARVRLQTFNALAVRFRDKLPRRGFPGIQSTLEVYCERQEKLFLKKDSAAQVRRYLLKIRHHVEDWRIEEREWPAIEPGLLSTYRQGRREYLRLHHKPTAANFHEWRKRVKTLGCQLLLIRKAWPRIIRPTVAALEQLGDYLGDDHDAAVLKEWLYDNLSAPHHETDALVELIECQQRDLRASALKLGARIYGEKPRRFSARLGAWWVAWRR